MNPILGKDKERIKIWPGGQYNPNLLCIGPRADTSRGGSQSCECLTQPGDWRERRPTSPFALGSKSPLCVPDQYPPSIEGPQIVKAYKGETMLIQYKSSSKDVTFTLRNSYTKDFKLFGKNVWLGRWGMSSETRFG